MRSSLVGVTVFAVSLLRSLADGFGMTDESWFLQVVARVRGGELLYRDVAYGATPLAVYVTSAISHLVGVEVLAVKIATCAAFALTIAIIDGHVRRAGAAAALSWLFAGLLILVARPYSNPPYTPMAMAMFCAALSASLMGTRAEGTSRTGGRPRGRAWLLAGACAGLSFASKQNVGLLALGASAATVVVWATAPRASVRPLLLVGTAFLVAVLLALTPLLLHGGVANLWDYGFAGKGAYLHLGGVNYAASLAAWLAADSISIRSLPSTLMGLVRGLVLILPLVVAVVAVARWRSLARADYVLLVFAVAATATAFPRWDRFHMGYAVPVHLLVLTALLGRGSGGAGPFRATGRYASELALRLAAALAFAVAVVPSLMAFADHDTFRPSTLVHFRGPLVPVDAERELTVSARGLADAANGRPTFMLGADAGFWYLETGLANPTPFDIPTATSVGASGVQWLEAAIVRGGVTQVCVDNPPPTAKDLVDLRRFVRDHLSRVADLGPCTLYRADRAVVPGTKESP